MPVTLYKRQKQILDYIRQYIQKFGSSPTLQEIADAISVSSLATVHEHLQTLEKKGIIQRFRGAVRGVKIIDKNLSLALKGVDLPILGYIVAGQPIEPYPETDATLRVSPTLLSGLKRAFVLQVRGDSMVDEGILDGDFVVVEEQNEVANGAIVIALLKNGFTTLKRFFKEKTRVRLEPANAKMKPIYATEVQIQGKVVGVIRRY